METDTKPKLTTTGSTPRSAYKRSGNEDHQETDDNNAHAPPVKVLKIFQVSPKQTGILTSPWQIRGQKCKQDIYVAYLQKGIATAAPEEPFLRNFVQYLRRNPKVRQEIFGVQFIVPRRGPHNTPMPRAPYARHGWNLFVTRGSEVGPFAEWLLNFENRLNSADFAGNPDLFLYSPVFKVTSYGSEDLKLAQDVMLDDDLCEFFVHIYDLTNAYYRINMRSLPFKDYFHNRQNGIVQVNQYLDSLIKEN